LWAIRTLKDNDGNLNNHNKIYCIPTTNHLQLMVWVNTPVDQALLPGLIIECEGHRFGRVPVEASARPPSDERVHLRPTFL